MSQKTHFIRLTLCVALLSHSIGTLAHELLLIPAPELESNWLRLRYSNIPATDYKFSDGTLTIRVDKSASPLLYPFKEPAKLKNIRLKGHMLAAAKLKPDKDDFVLRMGPALEGNRRLNAVQRMLAPQWIKELDKLAKAKGRKLGRLDLSLVASESTTQTWKQRQHPDTDLIDEKIVLKAGGIGPFDLNLSYPETSPPSLGLWIGSDGDNSGAQFSLRIDELLLEFYD
ncbi:hypothetical protein GW915_11555, partial [bacterium]|nr:hypothetical protein [bacterium]